MKHFLSIVDTPTADLQHVLRVAGELRDERHAGTAHRLVMAGKSLAMLFEKASLRTRVSFEQAVTELGGHAVVLGTHEVGLGQRESVEDVAAVLGGMVHGIAARVFAHQSLVTMSQHSGVPVINMLSDDSHPCQALADVMTIVDEFGDELAGRKVVFVGDGNNVARSLAMLCAKLGMAFVLASPRDYAFDETFVARVRAQGEGVVCEQTDDPLQAVAGADVIYTDTFVSMGQEEEKQARLAAFAGYSVDEKLMGAAPDHAIVLHCMPAYRGVEIARAVMDGPQCRAIPQAHNRLHTQKGLLAVMLGGM